MFPYFAPDSTFIPRGDELAAAEHALAPRRTLLVLAEDLLSIGVNARLIEDDVDAPQVLECKNPHPREGARNRVAIVCLRRADNRLQLRYHPSGDELGDTEGVDQPGTEKGIGHARIIALALSVPVRM
jgi:hypothetical protein